MSGIAQGQVAPLDTAPVNMPTSMPERVVAESTLEFLLQEITQTLAGPAGAPGSLAESSVDKDVAYQKLSNMGFRVGCGLVEKLTLSRARFVDHFDMVKFVCKEVWPYVFKKQIDNLKTNHRGVYVLKDNSFRWFSHLSGDEGQADTAVRAFLYPAFPCGLIRGVLANLGVASMVAADISQLPQCTFQIKVSRSAI